MRKTAITLLKGLLEIWAILFVLVILYLIFTADNADVLDFIIALVNAGRKEASFRFYYLIPALDELLDSILIPKPLPHEFPPALIAQEQHYDILKLPHLNSLTFYHSPKEVNEPTLEQLLIPHGLIVGWSLGLHDWNNMIDVIDVLDDW